VEGGAVAVRIRDRRAPILAALMLTVVIPVYGKLSDLFGRKPVLVIGVLVFLPARRCRQRPGTCSRCRCSARCRAAARGRSARQSTRWPVTSTRCPSAGTSRGSCRVCGESPQSLRLPSGRVPTIIAASRTPQAACSQPSLAKAEQHQG